MPSQQITLGLRSSSGRKMLKTTSTTTGSALRNAIRNELQIDEDFQVRRDASGRPGEEIRLPRTSTVASLKLKHGDVLYITPVAGTRFQDDDTEDMDASSSNENSNMGSNGSNENVVEDDVDKILSKRDGRIEQALTPNCQHKSTTQKCIYCSSKEPFDEEYLKGKGIKHMSFHSYIRKLSSGIAKGKYTALEDISCKIKEGCTTHQPWPTGICSSCQPPAITLNRQKYRHVDNVMFENKEIVDNFLSYWLSTGAQRVGILYGRYEVFEDVPLGIKAVVAAIYEPPQECTRDKIRLVPDENEDKVDALANSLGLQKVGWIFTDLIPLSEGRVRHVRNMDSHFLSAQECIMAGYFQSKNPNPCKLSSSGYFGSKFTTVIVTGNDEKQIHMEGYQVSNQCMALVRDDCLIPTKDAPELGYVKESTSEKYVPDVFYKEKDKYGNDVTKIARPLPLEYLLIDVPASTPLEPVQTFQKADLFPIENRPMEGHIQDLVALAKHRKKFDDITEFFRDFHLLLFLATQTVNPLSLEQLKPLLEAVRDGKDDAIWAFSTTEHWQTFELLLDAQNSGFQ